MTVERKHPLAHCENCPLQGKVGRYVPSAIPSGAVELAFVGEAPAKNEVAKQVPFVGPSGKLLDRVLDHYKVQRSEVLLTNACSCRYPDAMGELPLAAIEACRPRLEAELSQSGVQTIVAMGNSAIKGVAHPDDVKQGVTKFRVGPAKRSRFANIDLVPTFHPAACLRNQGNFPHMVTDVGKAIGNVRPELWYEPEYILIDGVSTSEFDKVIFELTQLNRGTGLVVDTESGNEKDSSFGNVHLSQLLCIGVGGLGSDTVYIFTQECLQETEKRKAIAQMLHECGVIAHNAKYDLGVLNAALEVDHRLPLLFDTMLASYALDERSGIHGLKYLATEFLGTPDYEAEIKPYIVGGNYATIPDEILYKYNAFDVHATRMLYTFLSNRVDELGVRPLLDHLHRASNMLTLVESRGLGFDMEYSDEMEARLIGERERVEANIPFNPRSHVQVKKYFSEFRIKLPDTQEATLVFLADKLPEGAITKLMVDRILEARGLTKTLGTYVTGLQEKVTANGTVHPSFLLHSTTTGRLSSRNPNAQNIPRAKELKRQFVPSIPGNVFVQCDYSQAELRVITWLAKESGYRDLFNDPSKDVFIELCCQLFPDYLTWTPVQQKEFRTLIKTFAYGIAYGRTVHGIASDPNFGMDIEQASAHFVSFRNTIPNIIEYQKEVIARVHKGEDLINPFGRHRRFYLLTDQNQQSVHNEAMAFMPQSTASDICVEAASRAQQDGVDIRNLIHDAILAECRPDEAAQIQALLQHHMSEVGREVTDGYVNFDTDGEVGYNWADLEKA